MTAEKDEFDKQLEEFWSTGGWSSETPESDKQFVYNNLLGFIAFMRRHNFVLLERQEHPENCNRGCCD